MGFRGWFELVSGAARRSGRPDGPEEGHATVTHIFVDGGAAPGLKLRRVQRCVPEPAPPKVRAIDCARRSASVAACTVCGTQGAGASLGPQDPSGVVSSQNHYQSERNGAILVTHTQ